MKSRDELIDDLLTLAFAEDVGDGDHTTLSTIPADERGRQRLIIKEEGILAGVEVARKVFAKFDPELQMTVHIHDGARVKPGDVVAVREKSKSLEVIADCLAGFNHSKYPWIEWDESIKGGKYLHLPAREDIPENIKEQLIVELYSK